MDERKFEERCRIFASHSNRLMCQALNILRDRMKADEVVQEARELFLLSRKEIKNPAAWLHTTVKNLACALKNRESKAISLERILDPESKSLTPLDCLLDKETKERVRNVVSKLPDIYRDAVMLYYFDGKSAEEAANLLGINVKTFLSRLHRARKYLFGLLGGQA
jgi:RNA polymerase sigma factor (sigma-70 family)